jgi:hypothetical protein
MFNNSAHIGHNKFVVLETTDRPIGEGWRDVRSIVASRKLLAEVGA